MLIGFGLVTISTATAQSKEEKREIKEWKKKLKKTDPLDFRDMVNSQAELKREASALRSQVQQVDEEIANLKNTIANKDAQIQQMRERMEEMQAQVAGASTEDWDDGVVYKVQVGAFRNKDLSQYQKTGSFWVEEEDGVRKYTIANFRDYDEATVFKNYMRNMGVRDAWIVAYEDGQRKDITEVTGGPSAN
jgi:TolA-binding protein